MLTLLSTLAIVRVSLLPLLFSVNVTLVPATSLPFKKPAVESLELTLVLTSVSAVIFCQADPS